MHTFDTRIYNQPTNQLEGEEKKKHSAGLFAYHCSLVIGFVCVVCASVEARDHTQVHLLTVIFWCTAAKKCSAYVDHLAEPNWHLNFA